MILKNYILYLTDFLIVKNMNDSAFFPSKTDVERDVYRPVQLRPAFKVNYTQNMSTYFGGSTHN